MLYSHQLISHITDTVCFKMDKTVSFLFLLGIPAVWVRVVRLRVPTPLLGNATTCTTCFSNHCNMFSSQVQSCRSILGHLTCSFLCLVMTGTVAVLSTTPLTRQSLSFISSHLTPKDWIPLLILCHFTPSSFAYSRFTYCSQMSTEVGVSLRRGAE